jgi:hypothetical protein
VSDIPKSLPETPLCYSAQACPQSEEIVEDLKTLNREVLPSRSTTNIRCCTVGKRLLGDQFQEVCSQNPRFSLQSYVYPKQASKGTLESMPLRFLTLNQSSYLLPSVEYYHMPQ